MVLTKKVWATSGVFIFAIVLLFFKLGDRSLWNDEWDSYVQSGHLGDIWVQRGNGILYYCLLNMWERLFGSSLYGMRSLSAVLSFLNLIVLFFIAKRMFKKHETALHAVFWVSISSVVLWHAREAHFYPLWIFCFLIAWWGFYSIREAPEESLGYVLYLGANALALLTHNYHAFYLLAFIVSSYWMWNKNYRKILIVHLPLFAVGGLILYRLYLMKQYLMEYLLRWALDIWSFDLPQLVSALVFYMQPPWRYEQLGQVTLLGFHWVGWVALVVMIFISLGSRSLHKKDLWIVLMILCWLPILLIEFLPLRSYARYYQNSWIVFILLAAPVFCSLWNAKKKSLRLVYVLLIFSQLIFTWLAVFHDHDRFFQVCRVLKARWFEDIPLVTELSKPMPENYISCVKKEITYSFPAGVETIPDIRQRKIIYIRDTALQKPSLLEQELKSRFYGMQKIPLGAGMTGWILTR